MWAKRVHNVEADIVCVGHTHIQFNLTVNGVVVINPGSVGLPRDGDPRAAFAIIEDNKIELKRVEYPIEQTVTRVGEMPWPTRTDGLLDRVLHSLELDLVVFDDRERRPGVSVARRPTAQIFVDHQVCM